MKTIRTISIKSGRPEDNGKRIKVDLVRSEGGGYKWVSGGEDCEVSGRTVAEACSNARAAWAGAGWDLRAKAMEF